MAVHNPEVTVTGEAYCKLEVELGVAYHIIPRAELEAMADHKLEELEGKLKALAVRSLKVEPEALAVRNLKVTFTVVASSTAVAFKVSAALPFACYFTFGLRTLATAGASSLAAA